MTRCDACGHKFAKANLIAVDNGYRCPGCQYAENLRQLEERTLPASLVAPRNGRA